MSQNTRPYEEIWPTLQVDPRDVGHEETIAIDARQFNQTLRERLPATPLGTLDDPESQFSVRRELGRGGMGAVHLATQISLGRDVALKVANEGAGRIPKTRCCKRRVSWGSSNIPMWFPYI